QIGMIELVLFRIRQRRSRYIEPEATQCFGGFPVFDAAELGDDHTLGHAEYLQREAALAALVGKLPVGADGFRLRGERLYSNRSPHAMRARDRAEAHPCRRFHARPVTLQGGRGHRLNPSYAGSLRLPQSPPQPPAPSAALAPSPSAGAAWSGSAPRASAPARPRRGNGPRGRSASLRRQASAGCDPRPASPVP